MEYKKTAIDKLIPYVNNARTHSEEQILKVASSIKEFGFINPVIIDGENGIIAGHCRVESAKRLGMTEVPTLEVKHLSEAQKKAYILADNRLAEDAGWDEEMLRIELESLRELEFDIDLIGFEIDDLFHDEEADGEIIEPPTEVVSELGDVWLLGNHRLMCGDSTSRTDVEKLMNGAKVKTIFSSPPYNMGGKLYENYKDNLESQKYIDFNLSVVNTWKEHLEGYLFWNISYNKNTRWEFTEILYRIVKETGLRFMELIVWDKGHGLPIASKDMLTRQYEDILLVGVDDNISNDMDLYYLGSTKQRGHFNKRKGKGISNYWKIGTKDSQLDNHQACFPVKLPIKGIKLTSNKGDNVADPFGGSGTTLIACENIERNCYMMELDPAYCDVIINRWQTLTGKIAVNEATGKEFRES